jgi:hypothetical protein
VNDLHQNLVAQEDSPEPKDTKPTNDMHHEKEINTAVNDLRENLVVQENSPESMDDDVFYLFLQKQKIGAELHVYLEEGTYHKRLFRGPNTNDMKK